MPDEATETPAAAPVAPPAPAVPTATVLPVVPVTPAVPAPVQPAPAAAPAEDPSTKALREANERIARLEAANLENLRARVVAETGIPAAAAEFLTATDEAGLKTQAEKIKGMFPAAPAASEAQAPAAGTTTQPAANQQPTLDERIAAAERAGKVGLSISLKREKAGMRA